MRRLTKSAFIVLGLAVVLASAVTNLVADENYADAMLDLNRKKQWVCEYIRAANDVLYLKCDDLARLLDDPLIMEDDQEDATKYMPIWRRPENDQSAIRLVESVLCNQRNLCSVKKDKYIPS